MNGITIKAINRHEERAARWKECCIGSYPAYLDKFVQHLEPCYRCGERPHVWAICDRDTGIHEYKFNCKCNLSSADWFERPVHAAKVWNAWARGGRTSKLEREMHMREREQNNGNNSKSN